MARPLSRRNLRFDSLESRQLLTAGGPTAEAQYMLEMINLARTNPTAAAERITTNMTPDIVSTLNYYGVDVNQAKQEISSATPQPPVAWSNLLTNAAQGHSQDMANTKVQSHSGSDGSTINSRINDSGYTNASSAGENAYAYATTVDEAMQAFLFDWGVADKGHRRNLLQPDVSANNAYRDVGIGIVRTNDPKFGPVVITQDFGSQPNEKAQLVGTVFNDNNGNHFYDIGEGAGNVLITATNLATGQSTSVQTWDAGGYQIPLDPGQYRVTASVNNQVVKATNVTINTVNVYHDFVLNDATQDVPASDTPVTPQVSTQETSTTTSTPAPATTLFKASVSNPPTTPSAGFLSKWSSWKAKIS